MENNNNNDILKKLVKRQLKNISPEYKLSNSDLMRISNNLTSDIFSNDCCIWNGYITNNNNNRAKYINFYFNKKKIALHRLLYINFKGELKKNEYIKYSCNNKGKCCNINHIKKKVTNQKKIKKNKKIDIHEKKKKLGIKTNIISFD